MKFVAVFFLGMSVSLVAGIGKNLPIEYEEQGDQGEFATPTRFRQDVATGKVNWSLLKRLDFLEDKIHWMEFIEIKNISDGYAKNFLIPKISVPPKTSLAYGWK